jgi:hypothetical protein
MVYKKRFLQNLTPLRSPSRTSRSPSASSMQSSKGLGPDDKRALDDYAATLGAATAASHSQPHSVLVNPRASACSSGVCVIS